MSDSKVKPVTLGSGIHSITFDHYRKRIVGTYYGEETIFCVKDGVATSVALSKGRPAFGLAIQAHTGNVITNNFPGACLDVLSPDDFALLYSVKNAAHFRAVCGLANGSTAVSVHPGDSMHIYSEVGRLVTNTTTPYYVYDVANLDSKFCPSSSASGLVVATTMLQSSKIVMHSSDDLKVVAECDLTKFSRQLGVVAVSMDGLIHVSTFPYTPNLLVIDPRKADYPCSRLHAEGGKGLNAAPFSFCFDDRNQFIMSVRNSVVFAPNLMPPSQ
jgi:hypothetical protein